MSKSFCSGMEKKNQLTDLMIERIGQLRQLEDEEIIKSSCVEITLDFATALVIFMVNCVEDGTEEEMLDSMFGIIKDKIKFFKESAPPLPTHPNFKITHK